MGTVEVVVIAILVVVEVVVLIVLARCVGKVTEKHTGGVIGVVVGSDGGSRHGDVGDGDDEGGGGGRSCVLFSFATVTNISYPLTRTCGSASGVLLHMSSPSGTQAKGETLVLNTSFSWQKVQIRELVDTLNAS